MRMVAKISLIILSMVHVWAGAETLVFSMAGNYYLLDLDEKGFMGRPGLIALSEVEARELVTDASPSESILKLIDERPDHVYKIFVNKDGQTDNIAVFAQNNSRDSLDFILHMDAKGRVLEREDQGLASYGFRLWDGPHQIIELAGKYSLMAPVIITSQNPRGQRYASDSCLQALTEVEAFSKRGALPLRARNSFFSFEF